LENEIVAVPINDYSRQTVALAPNDAAQTPNEATPRPIFRCLANPALEKIQIEILFPPRKSARHNLRLAVVNRAPDQVIFPVLEGNHIAVSRVPENLQHFAREHPIVSVENPRPRFDDNPRHEQVMNQENRKAGIFLVFPAFLLS
jgi:hypothetical protein